MQKFGTQAQLSSLSVQQFTAGLQLVKPNVSTANQWEKSVKPVKVKTFHCCLFAFSKVHLCSCQMRLLYKIRWSFIKSLHIRLNLKLLMLILQKRK